MKRFLTPFFLLLIGLVVYSIYLFTIDDIGWAMMLAMILLSIAGGLLIVDFILQKTIKKFGKIVLIEVIIIGLCLLVYGYQNRAKTLLIDDDYDQPYVAIIYGVEGKEDLSISPLHWTKKITIPANGILLTSSEIDENLPNTNIKFQTSKEDVPGVSTFAYKSFESDGKVYKYRSWKVLQENCCSYSATEMDSLTISLQTEFEDLMSN